MHLLHGEKRNDMTDPVQYVDSAMIIGVGQNIVVRGEEAKHAVRVRRIKPGQMVDLVDGKGKRAKTCITLVEKDILQVQVKELKQETQNYPQVVLVQALGKGGRDESAICAATEVGVDKVVPWQAERCVSRWEGKTEKGQQRWYNVVKEAAKQARRAWIPQVTRAYTTTQLVYALQNEEFGTSLCIVLHESAQISLADSWKTLSNLIPQVAEIIVLVGPEGGISEQEIVAIETAGAVVVSAGAHVMRTSTAGPVVVAYLQAMLGRW